MKKIALIFLLVACFNTALHAQAYSDFLNAFQNFTGDIATTLPAMSSVGLNWNDAYIGNFPHFAVGLTAGTFTIPFAAVNNIASTFGITSIATFGSFFQNIGFPLPIWCLDGRMGGFGIPFDIGLKAGFLPPDTQNLLAGITIDYLMIGGDFRLGLLEDKGPLPDISVGLGVNYLGGSVTIPGATPAIPALTMGGSYPDLSISQGDFVIYWKTLTIDLKTQVSKSLLFMTLSAGFAASYSVYAESGGGIIATINNTPAEIQQIAAAFPELDLTASQFIITGTANGWALRAFGGLTFDILVVKLDLSAAYNFLSQGWGASINLRVQL